MAEARCGNVANTNFIIFFPVCSTDAPDNASCGGNSFSMSNDVFESVDDEEDAISSRTVSHDKISTITEVTENSTSNSEERSRAKLLSTQSEPAGESPKTNGVANGDAKGADEGVVDLSLRDIDVASGANFNNGAIPSVSPLPPAYRF